MAASSQLTIDTNACSNSNGFFKIGEIRKPTDADFEHFLSLCDNHDGWTIKHSRPDINVWIKDIPGISVKMLKVHTRFGKVEPNDMHQSLEDPIYRTHWDDAMLADDTICRIEGCNSDICYYAMKCPTPLRNRDFIGQRCWKIVPNEEYICFNHSVAHDKYPPNATYIRGLSYVTGYIIRRSKKGGTLFCYVTHSDPRGKVPKWLLNIVASKIAPKVALKLGKTAENYKQWKEKQDQLPASNTTTDNVPVVSVDELQSLEQDNVPLTPVKGQPDYLADEETLEDTDSVPKGIAVDPMLLVSGHSNNNNAGTGNCNDS